MPNRRTTSRRFAIAAIAVALTGLGAEPGASEPTVRIVGAALTQSRAYEKLAHLTDRIGHRLSGSAALERAVEWAEEELRRDGLEHVWTEPVQVPHWVRGHEAARIVVPIEADLPLLALGGSVGTPEGGITADIVVVDGFEQLERVADRVPGKIVLFDKAIEAGFDADPGYGTVVRLRSSGPSAAAALGAVGMLIRSLGTADYRLPHTGALRYDPQQPKIPSAAITAEDAGLIRRLLASGDDVRVHLELGSQTLEDATSANVLADLPGREAPDEIVLIGAHLDSWDVGQGAHDDGAGCAAVMEAMRLIRQHAPPARRTIRAVLFTNEENGLRGGRSYAERHGDERHVAAIESDSGGARPVAFGVTAGDGGVELVERIVSGLAGLGLDRVLPRGGGADIGPLRRRGVPALSLVQDIERYFDFHHTEADTLDKVDRADLDRNVAALAAMAYALADLPETLAPPPPPEAAEE